MVIGGNSVAARKTARLLTCGAQVDLICDMSCDHQHPRISEWLAAGRINHLASTYASDLLNGHALIVIADSDEQTIATVRRDADRSGVPINVVDQLEHCTAITPAVIDRSPVLIAISTGGHAPELARMIRSRLEALLPLSIGPLARLAGSLQTHLRRQLPDFARRRFLHWLLTDTPARAIEQGNEPEARKLALQALASTHQYASGSVALVGAGPGDPELLTLRALRLIQEADVIVHDGLVDDRVLEHARRDAELIDVAKRRGHSGRIQKRIHQLLVEHARNGARVVRLKGGDPMVFGRGGEEIGYLREHDIDYQVVPGITAAVACGAYAGIPLTHRDHAQSVRLVTAHCKSSIDRLDWSDLAGDRQTLAFYMAVAQLEVIQQQLLSNGRAPETPVALVENGTRPNQRVVTTTLERLAAVAHGHRIRSPAMLYVGDVAALADQLAWYGRSREADRHPTPALPLARAS